MPGFHSQQYAASTKCRARLLREPLAPQAASLPQFRFARRPKAFRLEASTKAAPDLRARTLSEVSYARAFAKTCRIKHHRSRVGSSASFRCARLPGSSQVFGVLSLQIRIFELTASRQLMLGITSIRGEQLSVDCSLGPYQGKLGGYLCSGVPYRLLVVGGLHSCEWVSR